MPSPRRRLNFDSVALSPNRMIMSALLEEAYRLANLNLNNYSRNNRALAYGFIRAVGQAQNGNTNAMYIAFGNIPRVRRIGGGNLSPQRLASAHRAATVIQSAFRGALGRRHARSKRARRVNNPNGNIMVAVPTAIRR